MGKKNEGPGRQQDRTRHLGQLNANCIKIGFSFRNCALKIPKESRTSREKLVIKAHLENVCVVNSDMLSKAGQWLTSKCCWTVTGCIKAGALITLDCFSLVSQCRGVVSSALDSSVSQHFRLLLLSLQKLFIYLLIYFNFVFLSLPSVNLTFTLIPWLAGWLLSCLVIGRAALY